MLVLVINMLIMFFFTNYFILLFMKKKILELYLNKIQKEKLEIFFGVGSKIEIKQIFTLSQLKTEQVEVFVWITDPESTLSLWPNNVEYLVECGWIFINGKGSKCVVQSGYDII